MKAEMLDLRRSHWPSMCGEHFSEVLREGIDLLLEEEMVLNSRSSTTRVSFFIG
jgi:hypothetical protein